MPKAVPVTFAKFCEIEQWCKTHGGVEVPKWEVARTIEVFGLKHHIRVWGEIGFKFSMNGLEVVGWTSCLRQDVEHCRMSRRSSSDVIVSRPPGEDYGWIVIRDAHGHAQYYARPVQRTKYFVSTFLKRLAITLRKAQKRPTCPKCGRWMVIFRKKKTNQTFWACFDRSHADKKLATKDWDFALTPRMLSIAQAWRKAFWRYRSKLEHVPQRASTIRKGWIATKDPTPRK